MMANPKPGQRVQVWYAKRYAHTMTVAADKTLAEIQRGAGAPTTKED